jgi:hypothetical protein
MIIPSVEHVTTLPLKHNGDCSLLGVSPDGTIYAEEFYGENAQVAQHALRLDGTFVQSIDEADGGLDEAEPLALPPETCKPKTGWHTMGLNFAGPRHRGMRGPERTAELVQPMTIDEKMRFAKRLGLNIPAPMVLGVAESYVLAESDIQRPHLYFVCRRVRLAVALESERLDDEQQPYDYDTLVLYAAHFYDRSEELPLSVVLDDLTDVALHRPMDCLLLDDHLFIADGGAGERLSAIHVWRVELPGQETREDVMNRKLYG